MNLVRTVTWRDCQ